MLRHFSGQGATRGGGWLPAALTVVLAFSSPLPGAAQDSAVAIGVTTTDGGARIVYGPDYLAQFGVSATNELLQRIPGIQGALASVQPTKRGFGSSGDQVLVNGKRLSGKTNTISQALARIPAAQVDRVEVIRGAVAGLDVRSTGLVVNVVLKGARATRYGSWEATGSFYTGSHLVPSAQASYAGDSGALSWLVSARFDPPSRYDRFDRVETFFFPGSAAFERQDEIQLKRNHALIGTGSLAYAFANGDIVDLHARYADEQVDERETSDQYDPAPAVPRYLRTVVIEKDAPLRTVEVGGDYEHIFPGGNAAKGLFVYTDVDFAQDSIFTNSVVGRPFITRREQENRGRSEAIARGTYEWRLSRARQLNFGAEVAINALNKVVEAENLQAGVLRPTPLFNADARVRETRLEGFVGHIWQPRPQVFVETAAEIEYSRITQRGSDVIASRNFFYPRPRLEVRYDHTPRLQFRGRVERTVSQLSFEPFVASFIADDNRIGRLYAGNPDLRPEKAWLFEGAVERRLARDRGAIAFTGNYKKIADRLEVGPIVVPDGSGSIVIDSAPGNIGKGHSYDLRLNTTIRLDSFGLDGGIVDLIGFVAGSRVTDPFTFKRRRFENFTARGWTFRFRQDTRWHGFSYGFNTGNNAPRRNYDIDFSQTTITRPDLLVFIEIKLLPNLTARWQADKIFVAHITRERLQFSGTRTAAGGNLSRREFRGFSQEQSTEVYLRGTF